MGDNKSFIQFSFATASNNFFHNVYYKLAEKKTKSMDQNKISPGFLKVIRV